MSTPHRPLPWLGPTAGVVALALALAGCGWFGGERAEAPAASPAPATTPATTPGPAETADAGWWAAPRRSAHAGGAVVSAGGVAVDGARTAVRAAVTVAGDGEAVDLADHDWSLAGEGGAWAASPPGDPVRVEAGEAAHGWVVVDEAVDVTGEGLALAVDGPAWEASLPVAVDGPAEPLAVALGSEAALPEASTWDVADLPASTLRASPPLRDDDRRVRDVLAGLDAAAADRGVLVRLPADPDDADLAALADAADHYAPAEVRLHGRVVAAGSDADPAAAHAEAVADRLADDHGVARGRLAADGAAVAPAGGEAPAGRDVSDDSSWVDALIAVADHRLVELDRAEADARGESRGITVEVGEVRRWRHGVEVDLVARNDRDDDAMLVTTRQIRGHDPPRLRDDAGHRYLFDPEYHRPDHPLHRGGIGVDAGEAVAVTLSFVGLVPPEAEALELELNPELVGAEDPPELPNLVVGGIAAPDAPEGLGAAAPALRVLDGGTQAGASTSPGGRSPWAAWGGPSAYGGGADWARRAHAQTLQAGTLLAVTGVRGYAGRTEVDVLAATHTGQALTVALADGGAPDRLVLADADGRAHRWQPDADRAELAVEPAAPITGTLVFAGGLDVDAAPATLVANPHEPDAAAAPTLRVEVDLGG